MHKRGHADSGIRVATEVVKERTGAGGCVTLTDPVGKERTKTGGRVGEVKIAHPISKRLKADRGVALTVIITKERFNPNGRIFTSVLVFEKGAGPSGCIV